MSIKLATLYMSLSCIHRDQIKQTSTIA